LFMAEIPLRGLTGMAALEAKVAMKRARRAEVVNFMVRLF